MMRLDELARLARRRRLDQLLVMGQANIRAFTGVNCDSAVLRLASGRGASGAFQAAFCTDFRYAPMVRRVAPSLKVRDIRRFWTQPADRANARIGYESTVSHACFLKLRKLFPRAAFVDVVRDLESLRAVKTPEEIAGLRAAERLNCEIWEEARSRFEPGMTERQMARIVQTLMVERGEGEAFDTIVCVGPNAAECHHEPDDTVWDGRQGVLVDMGVRLGGFCSDLTRNIVPRRADRTYRKVYDLVLRANRAAIAAARPGMKAKALDKVARDVIRAGGFGKCFGHSLGHGVGYEIHEAPAVSPRGDMELRAGMVFTIEPGVYLEGNLGVRIEDMVLLTESGCEVLSSD